MLRRAVSAVLLLGIPGSAPPCAGQSAQPLTLDVVVAMLQSNLDSYDRSIPSFLADEHIESTVHNLAPTLGGSEHVAETIAESVFRLKRDVDPVHHIPVLHESREIKTINGKPANRHDIDAPTMLSGAFSGGLAMVSKGQQDCMRYILEPAKPRGPIVVSFVSAPAGQRPKDCILVEDASGRATIDPASMQITRIEINVPHHVIFPESADVHSGERIVTRWQVQVDYEPVVLDAQTFWLPKTIGSTCSADRLAWFFLATYRNYHLLEVHSRILVPTDAARQ